jgi:hypothetical protein
VVEVGARNERGQSIITVDRAGVHAFVAGLVGGGPEVGASGSGTPAPGSQPSSPASGQDAASVVVSVFNGTTRGGLATRVMDVLAAQGFRTGQTENAPRRQDRSQIVAGPSGRPAGERIATVLGGLPAVVEDPTLPPDRVNVVLGADYTGPGAYALAGPGLLRLDGTALLSGPLPSGPPHGQPAPIPTPGDDDAPITAGGTTCVN